MRSTLQFLRNAGDTRSALVTLGAAMVAALAVLVVAGSGSVKVIGAAMAGCMFLAGAIVLIYCLLAIIGTLVSDILLAWLDPRIRMES